MMKKLLTTAFCLSVIFMGSQAMAENTNSQTVYSQKQTAQKTMERKEPPNFNKRDMHKPPMMNLEEKLNLTEKQKAQAKANRIAGRKEMKPVMDEIRDKKEAILDVMDSDLSKEEQKVKIEALQKDIKALYVKANTMREKNMAEFEKILTKEQKAKFEQLKKEQHPNGFCKNCERRMPPPPMPQNDED